MTRIFLKSASSLRIKQTAAAGSETADELSGDSKENNPAIEITDSAKPQKSVATHETADELSSDVKEKEPIIELTDSTKSQESVATQDSSKATNAVHAATGNAKKEVTTVTLANDGFHLQYNQAIAKGAKIMFAVWSNSNGQDDLKWYTADSNGKATAKYTGVYGKYSVHTYQDLNKKMTGLNAKSVDVPKPKVKVSIQKASHTTYKVTVSDVPAYISSIQLPTWTEKGGQDDIVWYKTSKNGKATYSANVSLAQHNLESGKYNVHVYGTSAVTNSQVGLAGTSFQSNYKFGDVAVKATLGSKGIAISMPSDVSKDVTVYHGVWSAKNNQDDIVWYKVPANGQLTAKYTGDYGTYLIHTYGTVKGKMVCLNATSINVPKTDVKAKITKESATTYKVTVTNVPVYIDNIQLPTWTEKGGQDDIKWYKASKASDGSYYAVFSEASHNLEAGTYRVHVYGDNHVTNHLTGLVGTQVKIW